MGKRILAVLLCCIYLANLFAVDVRAEVVFGDSAKTVICNIIYAVETGGQTYGNARYDDFTEAYTNSSKEHAITIGAGQFYGVQAKAVLDRIRTEYPDVFNRLDTAGIGNDLDTKDWSTYKLSSGSAKAKCIQAIMSSEEGKKVQDAFMYDTVISKSVEKANELGITDKRVVVLFVETAHLGGNVTVANKFSDLPESSKTYEGFYQWLIGGNPSNQNAVNGTNYTTRHQAVKKMIDEHEAELMDTSSSSSSSSSSGVSLSSGIISEWDLVGMPSKSSLSSGYSKVDLPSYDDLDVSEMYSVNTIKEDIVSNNEFKLFDTVRVSVVFLGLLMVVYSVFLIVAYIFDRTNNIFEISLLSVISLGLLRYSDEEEHANRKGYVGKNRIIKISAACIVVGMFIISGGVFSWGIRIYYAISGVL